MPHLDYDQIVRRMETTSKVWVSMNPAGEITVKTAQRHRRELKSVGLNIKKPSVDPGRLSQPGAIDSAGRLKLPASVVSFLRGER
jgi:hypothetical protein